MRRLAVLSMHTSPLAQPGTGDGGGMNVYVRELSASLARAGVGVRRLHAAFRRALPDVVNVEPGIRVHHVAAGPQAAVPKEELLNYVDEFTAGVLDHMARPDGADAYRPTRSTSTTGSRAWPATRSSTSWAAARLDFPHARPGEGRGERGGGGGVRTRPPRPGGSSSSAVRTPCSPPAPSRSDQLVGLYGADPARIEIVSPGVDHAFFSPGDQLQARRAAGLPEQGEIVLFVGRIQPLKGADVAVHTLAMLGSLGHHAARLRRRRRPERPARGGGGGAVSGWWSGSASPTACCSSRRNGTSCSPPSIAPRTSASCRAAPSRSGWSPSKLRPAATPVVASGVGGLTMLVEDGVTGFLVEATQATSAERAVGFAGAGGRAARRRGDGVAGVEGRRRERARSYTWPIAAARLRRLYGDLTARALVECA